MLPSTAELRQLWVHIPGKAKNTRGKDRNSLPFESVPEQSDSEEKSCFTFRTSAPRLLTWILVLTEKYLSDVDMECDIEFQDEKHLPVAANAKTICRVILQIRRRGADSPMYTFAFHLKQVIPGDLFYI